MMPTSEPVSAALLDEIRADLDAFGTRTLYNRRADDTYSRDYAAQRLIAALPDLVAELERTEGDLAVAVREAGTARADNERLHALVAEVWDALHGNEQAVFKVAAAQQVIVDATLRSDHG